MKMSILVPALVISASFLSGGCASIVHSGPRSIPVASTPPGAKVSIYDRDNAIVSTHTTPFTATLSSKYGYFKGQNYRLVFEMPGYAPAEVNLESSVSGWYFGNLLLGGLLGMLVVDPLTGAMFNLTPEKIEQPLTAQQAEMIGSGEAVMVVMLEQATEGERKGMVRVN